MHICALVTRKLGYSLYPRLDTSDFDVMICETPYPATVAKNTKLVIHYHDAIPLLMPHTISDRRFHQAFHYRALRKNVESGAWFVCVSDATRKDLVSIFPQAESRSMTIHNMVSHHYHDAPSDAGRVPEIIRTRLNMRIKPPLDPGLKRRLLEDSAQLQKVDYLLIVSTIEPRKNHLTLLSAWEQLACGTLSVPEVADGREPWAGIKSASSASSGRGSIAVTLSSSKMCRLRSCGCCTRRRS